MKYDFLKTAKSRNNFFFKIAKSTGTRLYNSTTLRMEQLIRKRTPLRGSVTRYCSLIDAAFKEKIIDRDGIEVNRKLLEISASKMENLDEQILDLILKTDFDKYDEEYLQMSWLG